MAKAIAKSFPQLDCIVFDLPHVVSGLQGSENLKFVGGRRRWREVDVEVHGASQGKAEMLESLVVTSEHLAAADLGGFGVHLWF